MRADGHCMDAGNVSHDLMLHECGQTSNISLNISTGLMDK